MTAIVIPVFVPLVIYLLFQEKVESGLAVDDNGQYYDSQNVSEPHFYYTICLNSGYREYFKNHLQDIIDVIGVENIDGFFMDIPLKVPCKCEHCTKWCKMIVKDAIDLLLGDKLVAHTGPSTMTTIFNRQTEKNRDVLHILHYITEKRSEDIYTIEYIIPLYNIDLKILT